MAAVTAGEDVGPGTLDYYTGMPVMLQAAQFPIEPLAFPDHRADKVIEGLPLDGQHGFQSLYRVIARRQRPANRAHQLRIEAVRLFFPRVNHHRDRKETRTG